MRLLTLHRVLVAVTIVLLLWVVLCVRLLVFPTTDSPRQADAVVMLGGSSGARLDTARELMAQHRAPTLVISTPRDHSADRSRAFCAAAHPYAVRCFDPSPSTTRGEAEEIRRLARDNNWRTVIVVTSTFHVSRARMTVRRCYKAALLMVAPKDEHISWVTWVYQFGYQSAGWLQAQWLRGC